MNREPHTSLSERLGAARVTLITMLLFVTALAGTAMANGPAALPHDEHYPAAYLHKASIEEAREAEALMMAYLMRGHEGDEAKREYHASTDPDDWLRLDAHPFLDKVFPGAVFYETSPAAFGARGFAAVRNGKCYLLPGDVVRLLYDCGMRFDDDAMPNWLRAIAILYSGGPVIPDSIYRGPALFDRNSRDVIWNRVYRGELPYLPELEIESVRLDTAREEKQFSNPGRVWRAVIFIRRNGKKDSVEVQTMKNGRLPAMLGWTILSMPQSCLDAEAQMDDIAGAWKQTLTHYQLPDEDQWYCTVRRSSKVEPKTLVFRMRGLGDIGRTVLKFFRITGSPSGPSRTTVRMDKHTDSLSVYYEATAYFNEDSSGLYLVTWCPENKDSALYSTILGCECTYKVTTTSGPHFLIRYLKDYFPGRNWWHIQRRSATKRAAASNGVL